MMDWICVLEGVQISFQERVKNLIPKLGNSKQSTNSLLLLGTIFLPLFLFQYCRNKNGRSCQEQVPTSTMNSRKRQSVSHPLHETTTLEMNGHEESQGSRQGPCRGCATMIYTITVHSGGAFFRVDRFQTRGKGNPNWMGRKSHWLYMSKRVSTHQAQDVISLTTARPAIIEIDWFIVMIGPVASLLAESDISVCANPMQCWDRRSSGGIDCI